jgi:Tfp pilus assembly PilM family ATPase
MATRTSIELHPGGCRLVEVQLPARGAAATADARILAFAPDLPVDEAGLTAALAALKTQHKAGRETWVTVWGMRAAQQFLRLPPARPEDLEAIARREAKKDLAPLEADGDQASVALILGGQVQVGPHRKREVAMVAVAGAEVKRRIQPIAAAGFTVAGVLTPALALCAVARAQKDVPAGAATGYVALVGQATCLAIVRDGVLLFAREMPWGHATEGGREDAVAERLASELRRSVLYFKQTFRAAVERVVLCGDMPNLRALTGPLGTALSVEVRTLDSLVGIDAAALPEPADRFRAAVAGLRLAIAAGADPHPPANLLPANILVSRETRARVVRFAAAAAASVLLVLAAYVYAGRANAQYAREQQVIAGELNTLEPEARRRDEVRQALALASAQQAAIDAFETQGPRLARLLEALSQAAPDEILLTSIEGAADGVHWASTISGVAMTPDAATGQAAVNEMLRTLQASPFVGEPVQPPSIRVVSGRGAANAAATPDTPSMVIPDGMSGVEFTLQFRLPK